MSSNLPPGVTDFMLPGNRPEDAKAEAMADAVYAAIGASGVTGTEKQIDGLCESVCNMLAEAQSAGYSEAVTDEAMARSMAGPLVHVRVVDEGTDVECYVVCNAVDEGAIPLYRAD